MAFSGLSMLLVVFATILLPNIAVAKVHMVGDQIGWTNRFNYQAWAAGRTFNVGDVLVFRYPVGQHNVFIVNGAAFQSCTVLPPSEALTSGIDIVPLATPGRKWYICGVGNHCQEGQKLVIDVEPSSTVFPPSSPSLPFLPPLPSPRPAPVAALSPQVHLAELSPQLGATPPPESEAVPMAPDSEAVPMAPDSEAVPMAPFAPFIEPAIGLDPPAPAPGPNPPNALVKLKKFLTIVH